MEATESIGNLALNYLSIYDETGERLTSYVTKAHGETVEELQAKAAAEYPDKIHVVQTAEEYINALQNDLLYIGGEYVPRPEPTEAEKKAQALAALDNEYAAKIGAVETEMAKAKAIEDEDYFQDLKAERESLQAEYEEKRGAI